jgi:hypothetical protein
MPDTPVVAVRLHATERAALAAIVATGRASGRPGFTPSDAMRAAVLLAARMPEEAVRLPPVTRPGPARHASAS